MARRTPLPPTAGARARRPQNNWISWRKTPEGKPLAQKNAWLPKRLRRNRAYPRALSHLIAFWRRFGPARGISSKHWIEAMAADRAERESGTRGRDRGANHHDDGNQPHGDESDSSGDGDKDEDRRGTDEKKPSPFQSPWVKIGIGVVVVALLVGGLIWWLISRNYEDTDDAFIDTHMVRLAPQIAGQVTVVTA